MKLQDTYNEVSAKCADLNAQLNAALQDDASTAADFKKIKDELTATKTRRDMLSDQIKELEDKEAKPNDSSSTKPRGMKLKSKGGDNTLDKQKAAINMFVHSRGAKVTNDAATSVTSTGIEPLVPETIIYSPSAEINSVVDLSTLVTKTPVTTPKGTYPILKRADDSFSSVAELEENPSLAAPEFTQVDWSVATYRGAIPLSEESIADAQVDLTSLVGQNIGEKRVNTVNKLISPVLEGFTAISETTANLADGIKQVLNVKLDQAYARDLVVTASFYQILDTLKDNNGQYLLHQDITGNSGTTIFGVPVHIVNDTLLGADGEGHAFIGDLKRGVLFVDRQEVSLAWMKSEIYGQYLGAAMRFGVSQADANAGYFLTISDTTTTTNSTTASATTSTTASATTTTTTSN